MNNRFFTFSFGAFAGLLLSLCVIAFGACSKEEKKPSVSAQESEVSSVGKELAEIAQGGDANVPPKSAEVPKPIEPRTLNPEELDSMELVLTEPDDATLPGEKIQVYLLLYDKQEELAAASGKLELKIFLENEESETRKELDTRTTFIKAFDFKLQKIPGEDEPTLCYLLDTLAAKPGQTLVVNGKFAEKLETEDEFTVDEAETDVAPEGRAG